MAPVRFAGLRIHLVKMRHILFISCCGYASRCEWLDEHLRAGTLQLPNFPDFPTDFKLSPVVPIPRLLPDSEWLQSLRRVDHRSPPPDGRPFLGAEQVASQPVSLPPPQQSTARSALTDERSDTALKQLARISTSLAVAFGAWTGGTALVLAAAVTARIRRRKAGRLALRLQTHFTTYPKAGGSIHMPAI